MHVGGEQKNQVRVVPIKTGTKGAHRMGTTRKTKLLSRHQKRVKTESVAGLELCGGRGVEKVWGTYECLLPGKRRGEGGLIL